MTKNLADLAVSGLITKSKLEAIIKHVRRDLKVGTATTTNAPVDEIITTVVATTNALLSGEINQIMKGYIDMLTEEVVTALYAPIAAAKENNLNPVQVLGHAIAMTIGVIHGKLLGMSSEQIRDSLGIDEQETNTGEEKPDESA